MPFVSINLGNEETAPVSASETRPLAIISGVPLVASFLLASFCFYFPRIADPDLWWHLKAGEIIARTGDVPRQDIFSFTAPGAVWIDHAWATDLVFYLVYSSFGDAGLAVLKSLVGLALAAVLWNLTRSDHRGTQVLVFLLAVQILGRFFLYRPQIITYLAVALLLQMLSRRERIGCELLPTVSVVALFAVWANLHGGFLAGLALLGFHAVWLGLTGAVDASARAWAWPCATRLIVVLSMCFGATLANPYGFGLWEMLVREVTVNPINHRYIREWTSMSVSGLDAQLVLFMAVLAAVSFFLRREAWKAEDVWLCLGTLALAVYSVRNMPFFALACARPLARALGSCMSDLQVSRLARLAFLTVFGITLAPALVTAHLVISSPSPEITIRREALGGNPSGAVSFLKANNLAGNIFNPLAWGGYLIWHHPELRVAIDGRSSMVYPKQALLDTYRFYANESETGLPLERGADFVLLESSSPVATRMRSDSRWTLIYQDSQALLFAGPTSAGHSAVRLMHEGKLMYPATDARTRFP